MPDLLVERVESNTDVSKPGSGKHLAYLDGFRGLAAVFVMVAHTFNMAVTTRYDIVKHPLPHACSRHFHSFKTPTLSLAYL